eukprot:788386-Pleurochrysis_carterae.AAC.1
MRRECHEMTLGGGGLRHDAFQPFVQRSVSVGFAGGYRKERRGAARDGVTREPELEVAQGASGVGRVVAEREHGREGRVDHPGKVGFRARGSQESTVAGGHTQ